MENEKKKRPSTIIKHKLVYDMFLKEFDDFHNEVPKKWQTEISVSSIYDKISDITGYGYDSVCKIVNEQRREVNKQRRAEHGGL